MHTLDDYQTVLNNVYGENACRNAHTCMQTYIHIYVFIFLIDSELEYLLWRWGEYVI
jgi:hypothetical protein